MATTTLSIDLDTAVLNDYTKDGTPATLNGEPVKLADPEVRALLRLTQRLAP